MRAPPGGVHYPRRMSGVVTFDCIEEFCLHVLESPDLESKLVPPRGRQGGALAEVSSRDAVFIDRPARSDSIQIRSGSDKLPHLHELEDPHARAVCLERFANHELMAVELFAWALLAYPQMPAGLRRGLLHVLEEEQGHVRLYLDRLTDLGSGLGQSPLSDYFWQQAPGIRASANGPAAFLCVMGLTLEQANLDFTLLYRDVFNRHGDEPSAASINQVHLDEIGHVRLAAKWLTKLTSAERDVDAYAEHIPFPMSAARAKGRRFDVAARRRAGLSEDFIEQVRRARPYERFDPSSTR